MENNKYKDISFILRSPLSRKILEALVDSKEPITPTQIAKTTSIDKSNVSTKLKEIRERKLVECVNPDDRKWRFYKITEYGKGILERARNTGK